ncbi:MAG: helix-turn-helix domain-containing protein [Bacteroidia bacterium]|nr:helix-turn-helix domain-containing protein [Bacteroidia bacterium]
MSYEEKPMFALTVREFKDTFKGVIREVLSEDQPENKSAKQSEVKQDEHFTIAGLCKFLDCSKVSIHKYKQKGLPFYRIGKKLLFQKSEVLEFMRNFGFRKKIVSGQQSS